MKLLIDAHYYDGREVEGVNTYIKGIYTQLTAMAPDIDFYFASNRGQHLEEIFGTAPNIHYLTLRSNTRAGRLLREFPSLIKQHGFDAAHFQYMAPPVQKCRTILTVHDLLFLDFPQFFPLTYRWSRTALFRKVARQADVLAAVSDYSRSSIARHFSLNPDNIIVTHNAVDEDFFDIDRAKAREEIYAKGIRPFIMNVSRIEPRKKQLAVVRAFHELNLAERGYDLVLVNRHDINVPELEKYIASLPEKERKRIHRIEGMPHHELKTWYAAASLFIYPSLAEGFGIPPLEAAATGTPTICHNATAMADFTFFGDNLADLSDQATLNKLVEKNLTTPPSEEELKRIADSIRTSYSWRSSAERLLQELRTH